MLPGVIVTSVG